MGSHGSKEHGGSASSSAPAAVEDAVEAAAEAAARAVEDMETLDWLQGVGLLPMVLSASGPAP